MDPDAIQKWALVVTAVSTGVVWGVFQLLKKMGVIPDKEKQTAPAPCDDSDCMKRLAVLETEMHTQKESLAKLDKDTWAAFAETEKSIKSVAVDIGYVRGRIEK